MIELKKGNDTQTIITNTMYVLLTVYFQGLLDGSVAPSCLVGSLTGEVPVEYFWDVFEHEDGGVDVAVVVGGGEGVGGVAALNHVVVDVVVAVRQLKM